MYLDAHALAVILRLTASVPNIIMFHVMWNTTLYGTESELKDWAVEALCKRLPPSWRVREMRQQRRWGTNWPDAIVRLRGPDGTQSELVVELKRRLDPKNVPAVVERARGNAHGRAIWIVSLFLSPRTRERLKQERVSYADTTGNMWLVLDKPGLFVETMGAQKDPEPTGRSLTSLKGRAAGRVVRALCDYRPPYGIRELAERSRTALGTFARVVALLDREAIVVRSPKGGIADVDIEALIRRWAQDYSLLGSNRTQTFLEPRDFKALAEKLKDCRQRYAVTGSLAAATRLAVAPSRLAVIFVDNVRAAGAMFGLKPAESGANVILARPFDPVVYERGSSLDGVNYAAPSQVAADLLTSPGRGPSEGEELIAWMKGNHDAWRT